MNSPPDFLRHKRRLPAIAATVVLHVLLVLLWLQARQGPDMSLADGPRIQWVNVAPPRPIAQPVAVDSAPVRKAEKPTARLPVAALPLPAVEAQAVAEAEAVETAPAKPSAYEILQRARKDIAGIDKAMEKEFPEARIKAQADSPQSRLEKGIELAAEMAPPRWYEQAKIKELTVLGSYGARRYRIITAFGTYCVTYPANNTAAYDSMANGIKPQISTCPVPFGKPKA